MLLGPQEAVEKAENLIKDLKARVSQLVAEVSKTYYFLINECIMEFKFKQAIYLHYF